MTQEPEFEGDGFRDFIALLIRRRLLFATVLLLAVAAGAAYAATRNADYETVTIMRPGAFVDADDPGANSVYDLDEAEVLLTQVIIPAERARLDAGGVDIPTIELQRTEAGDLLLLVTRAPIADETAVRALHLAVATALAEAETQRVLVARDLLDRALQSAHRHFAQISDPRAFALVTTPFEASRDRAAELLAALPGRQENEASAAADSVAQARRALDIIADDNEARADDLIVSIATTERALQQATHDLEMLPARRALIEDEISRVGVLIDQLSTGLGGNETAIAGEILLAAYAGISELETWRAGLERELQLTIPAEELRLQASVTKLGGDLEQLRADQLREERRAERAIAEAQTRLAEAERAASAVAIDHELELAEAETALLEAEALLRGTEANYEASIAEARAEVERLEGLALAGFSDASIVAGPFRSAEPVSQGVIRILAVTLVLAFLLALFVTWLWDQSVAAVHSGSAPARSGERPKLDDAQRAA